MRGAVTDGTDGTTTGAKTGLAFKFGLYGVVGTVTTFGAVFGCALGSGMTGGLGVGSGVVIGIGIGDGPGVMTDGAGVDVVGGITVEPQPPGAAAVAHPPEHTGVGSEQPSL